MVQNGTGKCGYMGTLQSSFLLGKWLPSLPNHNRLTESVEVSNWLTETVEGSDWLTESVEVSDWLTETVEVSDWLTKSVEGSDWLTESVEVSDWLTESVEVSDWLTESVEGSDWLEGSCVLFYCPTFSLPSRKSAIQGRRLSAVSSENSGTNFFMSCPAMVTIRAVGRSSSVI